jgi:hypothetical protein
MFSPPAESEANDDDSPDREWKGVVTVKKGPQSSFAVRYDRERMYSSGVKVRLAGDAAEYTEATDDGRGSIAVKIDGDAADSKNLTVVISPA